MPDLARGPISAEINQWLGRASALVEASGDVADFSTLKVAAENLGTVLRIVSASSRMRAWGRLRSPESWGLAARRSIGCFALSRQAREAEMMHVAHMREYYRHLWRKRRSDLVWQRYKQYNAWCREEQTNAR